MKAYPNPNPNPNANPNQEHLFIVCELLRDNLYELYKYISRSDWTLTLTLALTLALTLTLTLTLALALALALAHEQAGEGARGVGGHHLPVPRARDQECGRARVRGGLRHLPIPVRCLGVGTSRDTCARARGRVVCAA